ncbi:MAG: bifunctional adenosylcobinamide kinase/adenosylcobinamide-phosphate guanylyltransferase [Kiritimatiellae bacterium]|nr:bifunctional adenosylcobinamide kinase/adenosylcobinamide-phosphate guanylyltransferase [Kiritimatiellia bacterium]
MVHNRPNVTLILGGARSGKSRHAQTLAESAWQRPIFLASAEALDDEMRERIVRHQSDRGPRWQTMEEPLDVARLLRTPARDGDGILWDCATVWLSNTLLKEEEAGVARRQAELLEALRSPALPVIVVSNEVGMGLVPPYPLGRQFRDLAGRLNQELAALASRVVLIVAGLPLVIKAED